MIQEKKSSKDQMIIINHESREYFVARSKLTIFVTLLSCKEWQWDDPIEFRTGEVVETNLSSYSMIPSLQNRSLIGIKLVLGMPSRNQCLMTIVANLTTKQNVILKNSKDLRLTLTLREVYDWSSEDKYAITTCLGSWDGSYPEVLDSLRVTPEKYYPDEQIKEMTRVLV